MPQVTGRVVHGDGSAASGRKVSGVVAGVIGGMVGPTHTDNQGWFALSWSSSTNTLAKLFVDGDCKLTDVEGDAGTIRL